MKTIAIIGAGKVGSLIACLLAANKQYDLTVVDVDFDYGDMKALAVQFDHITLQQCDSSDDVAFMTLIQKLSPDAIVSSLPYFLNVPVAKVAKACGAHYFDLTEDRETTRAVRELSQGAQTAFVPQCGLAPGFISIVANDIMQGFHSLETVKCRVGALPVNPSNVLHYALNWSTEGLINEYGNLCSGIIDGEERLLEPLEGYETLQIDGLHYEAFNTSGGLGSLAETYAGKVTNLTYKTIRYPGHCEKIHFLMQDLRLNDDRGTLKTIFERALPKTYQDVVIIYVSVCGQKEGEFIEETYVKKVYPEKVAGRLWSAIQVTTASSICSVVDLVLQSESPYQGLVLQEQFPLSQFLSSEYAHCYR